MVKRAPQSRDALCVMGAIDGCYVKLQERRILQEGKDREQALAHGVSLMSVGHVLSRMGPVPKGRELVGKEDARTLKTFLKRSEFEGGS